MKIIPWKRKIIRYKAKWKVMKREREIWLANNMYTLIILSKALLGVRRLTCDFLITKFNK